MQVDCMSSRIFIAGIQGESLTQSGFVYAQYLLQQDLQDSHEDGEDADHLGEPWAQFFDQSQYPCPHFTTGQVNGTIVDEQGKFPINCLVDKQGHFQAQYKQIFEKILASPPFCLEHKQRERIVWAIKDWIDKDSFPSGEFGFEFPYYQKKNKEYLCKNGPLECLDELTLVSGITEQIYQGKKGSPGLRDLCTLYSTGKININTASATLLAAMVNPSITQETAAAFAQNMLQFRNNPMHFDFLTAKDWYRNRMAGFNDVQLPSTLITTKSQYFSVLVQAHIEQVTTSALAYVHRTYEDDHLVIQTERKEFH